MSLHGTAVVNAVWMLVIEQGHSRRSAALKLGLTESRVDCILNALHARKRRMTPPQHRRSGKPCIVILEDDPFAVEMVEHMLSASGIRAELVHAASKEDFLHALDREHVDVVISDSSLRDIKPLKALQLSRQQHPQSEFFILSGQADPGRATLAKRAGVMAYVEKRRMQELVPLIQRVVSYRISRDFDV